MNNNPAGQGSNVAHRYCNKTRLPKASLDSGLKGVCAAKLRIGHNKSYRPVYLFTTSVFLEGREKSGMYSNGKTDEKQDSSS